MYRFWSQKYDLIQGKNLQIDLSSLRWIVNHVKKNLGKLSISYKLPGGLFCHFLQFLQKSQIYRAFLQ